MIADRVSRIFRRLAAWSSCLFAGCVFAQAPVDTGTLRDGAAKMKTPMRIRGINYDTGTKVGASHSRPTFDPVIMARELAIIRDELHCNAVRISGSDTDRLCLAAERALADGLEVWLSPHFTELPAEQLLPALVECAARAETLRRKWPRLVFVGGGELTLFMPGILPGKTLQERMSGPALVESIKTGAHNAPLNAFLTKAAAEIRNVFRGKVTYASAPLEAVDWTPFDIVSVDHYREVRNRSTYVDRARSYARFGKPVVITEVGCCTYQGAADKGGRGFMVMDRAARGRQLVAGLTRDEAGQAAELRDLLTTLHDAGVEGTFVFTFVAPTMFHSRNPLYDFDLGSYALVKSYDTRYGSSFPGLPWDKKESFLAVASLYGSWAAEERTPAP